MGPQAVAVEMRCTDVRWERPPLKRLLMDVSLRDSEGEARWFVLPKTVGAQPASGGVDSGDALEARERGRVCVLAFRGTGGFQALLLPAAAEVRLSGVPVALWGDLPKSAIAVRVIVARDVRIGGTGLNEWLGRDASCDRGAAAGFKELRSVLSREMPGGKEQPVEFVEPQEIVVHVEVPKEGLGDVLDQ